MFIGARRTLLRSPVVAPAAPPSYTAEGVRFDGSNDWLGVTGTPSGAADGKKGILSFWFKMKGGDSTEQVIVRAGGGVFQLDRLDTNVFRFLQGGVIDLRSTSTFTSAMSDWAHLALSFDNAAGPAVHLYVNGVDDANYLGGSNANVTYTSTFWGVMAGASFGGSLANIEVADFYFNTAEYLDLSNSANLQKFRSAGGAPVDLGSDGSTPTGAAPLVFFKGAAASWHTNLGTGGAFTLNGTLAASADNPP